MRILLVCSAGMSTSLLVTKMVEQSKALGNNDEIWAVAGQEAPKNFDKCDVVLLGPQVRFMKAKLSKQTTKPIDVIDMTAYGRVDGKAVLEAAYKLGGK